MKKLLRYIISATALVAPLAILLLPFISDAQGVTLLQNDVFGNDALASKEPGKYLQNIYVTAIGLAGIMAVVILVWGGFELIASPVSEQMRTNAKARIWAALGGLLLVLASVTILGTINPAFTKFNFELTKSAQTGTPGGTGATAELSPEEQKRGVARLAAIGVAVNSADQRVTDVTGLPEEAYTGLEKITKATGEKQTLSGGVEIHGGNELKSEHKPGAAVVDLKQTAFLDKYFTEGGTPEKGKWYTGKNGERALYEPKGYNGSTGDHYHIRFPTNGTGKKA